MKKILAIVLCAAAVLSVMTVMAVATQGMRGTVAASGANPPLPTNDGQDTTTTKAPSSAWNPLDTWAKLKNGWSSAKNFYNDFILFWQKILLAGLKFLQLITGNFAFLR